MFCHMIIVQYVTWKHSDWHARNPEWLSQQTQESARCTPDPFGKADRENCA